jgi:hypothetical protein
MIALLISGLASSRQSHHKEITQMMNLISFRSRSERRSILKMCAIVKMQTLIRIVVRSAVEHGIAKHTLLAALSDEYDLARNAAKTRQ